MPGVADDAFDTARRELYAAVLADFTPTRARLAAEAKNAGARDLATDIAALRKPTRAAWTVNQLAHRAAGALAELAELADALRAAQTALDGPQLRALSLQRRQVIDALVDQALRETDQAGAPEALRAEVRSTLEAALADSDVRAEVRAGLLVRAAQFSGFGELGGPVLSLVPDTKVDQTVSSRRGRAPTPQHSGKPATSAKRPGAQEAAEQESGEEAKQASAEQQESAKQASAEVERKRAAAERETERRERQRAAGRTEAQAAAAAANSALSAAVEAEAEGSRQVRFAQEQLADARRRLDDARLDVRRARSEQAKATRVLRELH